MSYDLTEKLPQGDNDTLRSLLTIVQSLSEDLRALTHLVKTEVKGLSRALTVLNDAILKIHVDLRDIDERLHRLEIDHNRQNSTT